MGKECGAWVSRRLWGGGNTSPLKTTAWEATTSTEQKINLVGARTHACADVIQLCHKKQQRVSCSGLVSGLSH